MGRSRVARVAGLVFLSSGSASAQGTAPEPAPFRPRLVAVVGADAGLAFGNSCVSTSYDTASCSSINSLPWLRGQMQLRLAPAFSLGLLGMYSWGSRDGELPITAAGYGVGATDYEHVSRLSAEGRWHVRGDKTVDPSVGFEIGLVHTSNHWQAASGSHGSSSDTAPAFGPNFALDFAVGRHLALGLVFRTAYLLFDEHEGRLSTPITEPALQGHLFATSLGLSFGGVLVL